MNKEIYELHGALLDLIGIINQPHCDNALIQAAGISLDRALFPLLVRIERRGPMGIVELADLAGRDYTTVSRQVAKLEGLKLVTRRAGKSDARIREVKVTKKGLEMTKALDLAREKRIEPIFAKWNKKDRQNLITLLRRFADDARIANTPDQ